MDIIIVIIGRIGFLCGEGLFADATSATAIAMAMAARDAWVGPLCQAK